MHCFVLDVTLHRSTAQAGVGRTGTFIVIDHGLRLLARDGAFNVVDTIRKLRNDRVSIVQTVEQYNFVHAILLLLLLLLLRLPLLLLLRLLLLLLLCCC